MSKKTPQEQAQVYDAHNQTVTTIKTLQLTDNETGEQYTAQGIKKTFLGTKQFWKLYLSDFLTVLGLCDSRQLDVLIYVLDNTDARTNLFLGTYDKIVEDTGISRPTVCRIMRKLLDNNFITRRNNGVYRVNPNLLCKGDEWHRRALFIEYEDEYEADREKRNDKKRSVQLAIDENSDIVDGYELGSAQTRERKRAPKRKKNTDK